MSKSTSDVGVKKPRGRAWLDDVGGGPQRLSDVATGHSNLHWRLPLYESEFLFLLLDFLLKAFCVVLWIFNFLYLVGYEVMQSVRL